MDQIDASELLRLARDAAKTGPRRRHNYYCADSATWAARIVGNWSTAGFRTTTINCQNTGLSSTSVRTKLLYGIEWMADNATDEKTKKFFADLYASMLLTHDPAANCVYLSRRTDVVDAMCDYVDESCLDHKASLLSWLASDPPMRTQWPREATKFNLSQEDLMWFQDKLREIHSKGYIAIIKPTKLKFIRHPVEEGGL